MAAVITGRIASVVDRTSTDEPRSNRIARGLEKPVSVVFFDDSVLTRTGIESLLEPTPLARLVATTGSLRELERIFEQEIVDLLIIAPEHATNSHTQDAAGLARTRGIRVLSLARTESHDNVDATVSMIGGEFAEANLAEAIRTTARLPLLVRERVNTRRQPRHREVNAAELTPREQQIAALVAQGLPNREIAHRLGMKEHNLRRAVSHIMAKWHCKNRTMLAARAWNVGLVTADLQAAPRIVINLPEEIGPTRQATLK